MIISGIINLEEQFNVAQAENAKFLFGQRKITSVHVYLTSLTA